MHFNILTLFPDMFPGSLGHSLAGKALERSDWSYNAVNIRNHAKGVHKSVDDTPYGGGAGMVMRADVLENAFLSLENPGRRVYLSPRGPKLTQNMAIDLSKEAFLTLLCGRYEGVDQRFLEAHEFEEISIGDYVLSGGEPAALILMDTCIRLLPGVMGNEDTADNESFGAALDGGLEYSHYTRPASWQAANGQSYDVPSVLTGGNHREIEKWRREESRQLTQARIEREKQRD